LTLQLSHLPLWQGLAVRRVATSYTSTFAGLGAASLYKTCLGRIELSPFDGERGQ